MKRTTDYRVFQLLIITFFPLILSACQSEILDQPNVVYILADDLGYGDLSCLGQEKLLTPHIDRLAEEGMIFTNHYSGNTVCSPSRATLMTGQDPGHVHARGNAGENLLALDSTMVTLPRLFKNAGYLTGAFGKWGLGYTFMDGSQNPLTHGFDEFYGTRTQVSAHTYFTDRLVHNGQLVDINQEAYMHDYIIDHALRFIKRSVAEKKPFFCYIPTPIPHAAMQAPAELHEKWREKYPEFDHVVGTYRAGPDESCPDVVNPIAGFGAMMEVLDHEVGRILQTLEELGVDKNTLVIFTSDNGTHIEGGHDPAFWNSNGPFRGHKRDLYEGGIHAPFLVRWPGKIKPGSTSDHISAFWDILPTMAELTGQPLPEQVNGISLLPALRGNEKKQEEHAYLYFEYCVSPEQIVSAQAIRMGDWKAHRKVPDGDKKDRKTSYTDWPIELYNLSTDIGEENNLADQHPELVTKARTLMEEARVDLQVQSGKNHP